MTTTLCLRPVAGEPCETVKYLLREPRTVVAVAARHVVVQVGLDPDDGATAAVWIDSAVERARPVDVRLELTTSGDRPPVGGRLLGSVAGSSGELAVYGTYLGPVSDEN
jgi:hypothetical protein